MITRLYGCSIFDGERDELMEGQSIYIRDDTIIHVGKGRADLVADVEICGQGKVVIPGLMNLHVHINRRHVSRTSSSFRQGAPAIENSSDAKRMMYAARNAWYELMQGITTMRDLCSVGRTATELKEAIEEGLINGPRLVVCGMAIAVTGGHETHRYKGAVEVDGPDEVTKATRNEIRLGADFIKLMVSGGIGGMPEHEHPSWSELNVEEITAACRAAHSHNRGVTVHAMGELPVMNALVGGVDGIEHGAVLTERALHIMKERDVYYVPTASGITAVADREAARGNAETAQMIRSVVVQPQRESIRKAHEFGIRIGSGSDTLGSVLEELRIFIDCGMNNVQALRTATSNAAGILGMEDRLGYIREGYQADLVLLDGNPLENIDALQYVHSVFVRGKRVSHEWLCNLN